MIGIYKITNPKGRIYIGQSTNIEKRFKQYKSLKCKNQTRLFKSFMIHGVDSHIFETIEECSISELNNRERFWQDKFNCISSIGLNCNLTNSETYPKKLYCGTFLKMRGRTKTAEHFKKIILDNSTGIFYFGVKEAAEVYGLNKGTLTSRLSGLMINNTNFIYV